MILQSEKRSFSPMVDLMLDEKKITCNFKNLQEFQTERKITVETQQVILKAT